MKDTGKLAVQLIGAGVLGSAFTLVAVSQFDLLDQQSNEPAIEQSTPNEKPSTTEQKQPTQQGTKVSSNSLSDVITDVSKGVVGVVNYAVANNRFVQGEIENGVGSGVIYKVDGDSTYIVTNNHVIEGANRVEISLGADQTVEGEVVGADVLTDLAVVKIKTQEEMQALPFGETVDLRIGEDVIAIGNPLGLNLASTATKGIISGLDRTMPVETSQGMWELNVLQTDAAINPGNSGGALFNMNGEVIGINTLKIASEKVEGLGFAIPSEEVQTVADELIAHGEVKRPMLGVRIVDLSQYANPYAQLQGLEVQKGIYIQSVEPDSVAEKAGMKPEDILVKLNDTVIESNYDLRRFLYSEVQNNPKVTATVKRGDQEIELELNFKE